MKRLKGLLTYLKYSIIGQKYLRFRILNSLATSLNQQKPASNFNYKYGGSADCPKYMVIVKPSTWVSLDVNFVCLFEAGYVLEPVWYVSSKREVQKGLQSHDPEMIKHLLRRWPEDKPIFKKQCISISICFWIRICFIWRKLLFLDGKALVLTMKAFIGPEYRSCVFI